MKKIFDNLFKTKHPIGVTLFYIIFLILLAMFQSICPNTLASDINVPFFILMMNITNLFLYKKEYTISGKLLIRFAISILFTIFINILFTIFFVPSKFVMSIIKISINVLCFIFLLPIQELIEEKKN